MRDGPAGWRRPAAVAGQFYPADAARLGRLVDGLLDAAPGVDLDGLAHAVVVPHAGLVYSGPTAAVAYRWLAEHALGIRRIVLAGPAHRVPVAWVAGTTAATWGTPLGDVAIDAEAVRPRGREAPVDLGAAADRAHQHEHCLEVQLPFLQRVLPDVPVVPLLVGSGEDHRVAALLRDWWSDPQTLILVSTDLSHYLPAEQARVRDARTAHTITERDADALADDDACGVRPLRALLRLAAMDDTRIVELDVRNSADTAGTPERVVGYGAFALTRRANGQEAAATSRRP